MRVKITYLEYINWYIEQAQFAIDIWSRSTRRQMWADRIRAERRNLAAYREVRRCVIYEDNDWLMSPVSRVWHETLRRVWQIDNYFGISSRDVEAIRQKREVWGWHRKMMAKVVGVER